MRWVGIAVFVVAASACSDGGTEAGQPALETYSNDLDGVTVSYPATWHRAETPLAAAHVGGEVEVLGLATGELPAAEEGCSPRPWAAMRAMDTGDLVVTLRVADEPGTDEWLEQGREAPLESKPDDLLGQEPLPPGELPGGCAVDGVEERSVDFLVHERRYTAFLAYRGELSDQRRTELGAVWSSLTLRPIPTADDSAAAIGQRYWHVLLTHCGIRETHFAGRDWIAEPALHDQDGSPPQGWDGPYQAGVMTLTSQDTARFDSRDGQRHGTFRPRTPTDPPAEPCE